MLRNTLQVKGAATTVTLLGLLRVMSPPSYSQQKDVFGWQSARWGMSNEDIVRMFGVRLKKLPKSEVFLGWHVDYVIPQFKLKGKEFTVYFQISDTTKKLSQILITLNEQKSPLPREKLFNSLESLLERQYGKASVRCSQLRMSLEDAMNTEHTAMNKTRWVWIIPTTIAVMISNVAMRAR